jgi:SAM-dependent methyltransferase
MITIFDKDRLLKKWDLWLKASPEDLSYSNIDTDLRHYNLDFRKSIYSKYLPGKSRIAFMGSGNGREVRDAIDLGYDAIAVNGGVDELIIAKRKFNIDNINCDFHFTEFKDNELDAVGSFFSLEHSPVPLFALSEWYRITKPLGKLFIMLPGSPELHQSGDVTGWRHPIVLTELQTKKAVGMVNYNFLEMVNDGFNNYFVFEKPENDDKMTKEIKDFIYSK